MLVAFGVAEFHELLYRLIDERGLTLRAFAKKVKHPHTVFSAIKAGTRPVPLERVPGWAEALGVEEGSDDWWTLLDLAAKSHFPPELRERLGRVFDRQHEKAAELRDVMRRLDALERSRPPQGD